MPQQDNLTIEEQRKRQFELIQQIRQIVDEEIKKLPLEGDIDTQNTNVEQVREIIREELPALLARSIVSIEGNLELLDSRNIIVGTTTGSKIGTATSQKLAFFNSAPITQPANTVNLTTLLSNLGLRASGGNPPITIGQITTNDFIEGSEIADPAAPAVDNGRLYIRDNGAGKTQLVVRFNTGAIQVIATEP